MQGIAGKAMVSAMIAAAYGDFFANDVAKQGFCRENTVPNWNQGPRREITRLPQKSAAYDCEPPRFGLGYSLLGKLPTF